MTATPGPISHMHIISLGWLFVALMIAVGQPSPVAGLLSFVGWGPLPLLLFWYLFGRRRPGRARRSLSEDE